VLFSHPFFNKTYFFKNNAPLNHGGIILWRGLNLIMVALVFFVIYPEFLIIFIKWKVFADLCRIL